MAKLLTLPDNKAKSENRKEVEQQFSDKRRRRVTVEVIKKSTKSAQITPKVQKSGRNDRVRVPTRKQLVTPQTPQSVEATLPARKWDLTPDAGKQNQMAQQQMLQAQLESPSRVTKLAGKALSGHVFSHREASEEAAWLLTIKASMWRGEEKRAYNFLHKVLRAVVDGEQPSNIARPDGGFFRWPSIKAVREVEQRELRQRLASKAWVTMLAEKLLHGYAPPRSEASEELARLVDVDVSLWSSDEKRRYKFLRRVLEAVVEQEQPSDITTPDGDYFRWPSTDIMTSAQRKALVQLSHEIGVLKSMGYRVGLKAKPLDERRRILARVYERPISLDLPLEYLNEWGQPATSTRLHKLANAIATFAKNMKSPVKKPA